MKAITTKYRGPTDTRGSRIIASDEDGNRITISYPYELSGEAVHRKAAEGRDVMTGIVYWTNCNRMYSGRGEVSKTNAKTMRVRLLEDVPSQIGYEPYQAGREIIVPVNGTRHNCFIPGTTDHESV